jgi:hypothetical protein
MLDEGATTCIMSLTSMKDLGSPQITYHIVTHDFGNLGDVLTMVHSSSQQGILA